MTKIILNTLHLQVDSALELTLEHNKLILSSANQAPSLEGLLAGSPKSALALDEDDKHWLNL
jgi:antitoxin component of MazEF toxin-antitoxin module